MFDTSLKTCPHLFFFGFRITNCKGNENKKNAQICSMVITLQAQKVKLTTYLDLTLLGCRHKTKKAKTTEQRFHTSSTQIRPLQTLGAFFESGEGERTHTQGVQCYCTHCYFLGGDELVFCPKNGKEPF